MSAAQGTPEWLQERCGNVTASRIADLMAKTKSGYSASRANYRAQLVTERLTGAVAPSFSNDAMRWGTETEPFARAAYEGRYGVMVDEVGYVPHFRIGRSGASPDGLVGIDGMLEIKCPNTATHIETLLSKSIPANYQLQMLWQMACAGRVWCDYVSFDPRMPEKHQFFCMRLPRSNARIQEIESEVLTFIEEVEYIIYQLEKL